MHDLANDAVKWRDIWGRTCSYTEVETWFVNVPTVLVYTCLFKYGSTMPLFEKPGPAGPKLSMLAPPVSKCGGSMPKSRLREGIFSMLSKP